MKLKKRYFLYFFFFIALFSKFVLALDRIEITEKHGLFNGYHKTVPIISTRYVGWLDKWAGIKFKQLEFHPNTTNFSGSVEKLNLEVTGNTKKKDNALVWTYHWQANKSHENSKGFGIDFKLKLDSPSFLSTVQDPELLPNNEGWQWQTPNGQSIKVSFAPPLAKLYFERNNKNTIRALFYSSISAGSQQTTMTVNVSNKVETTTPAFLNYDVSNSDTWHKDILPSLSSPVDLSFLNQNNLPAGKHGFIKRKNDHLVFEDGTPAKFWGTNIQASALFMTSDSNIKQHAKRIAQLGFNLIRFHHHDSIWVKPNIFKNPDTNTLELSPSAFKKLDWWIKCLKDEGVYIWLDLHVGRAFTKNDGIDNFDDFAKAKRKHSVKGKNKGRYGAKGFSYYNNSIQAAMQTFNENYLNHVNSFTGLAFKDDPAVIAVLITNENDLTQHFGNSFLPNRGVPVHNAIFTEDVKRFSNLYKLPYKKTLNTWEMGESKIYLSDVEHRFNEKMISHLDKLGIKSLVATTNSWGRMGIYGLPSLTDGSIIDAHSYGRAEEISYNPRYYPGFLTWIGAAQVSGYPLSVTEWNIEPFPARDRFIAPLFTAGIASLQEWDAMMLFGYSNGGIGGKRTKAHNYSSYNDPAIMGLMPAAALLYRQNHVAAANNNYALKLSRNDFFFIKHNPHSSKTVRTLLETSRLSIAIPETPELPWLPDNLHSKNNTITINDPNKDFIPANQNFVESDTGELKRDWEHGIHTVNTSKSQVASGWIGGKRIQLGNVEFNLKTKKAVVAVQSLEDKPLIESNTILITAMARSKPAYRRKPPFLSEPVVGEIQVTAPAGLQLFPVTNTGTLGEPISTKFNSSTNLYRISLAEEMQAHWYLLKHL